MDGWDTATTELIHWFLQQSPPLALFALDPARTVVEPSLFFHQLKETIASGPGTCGADVMRDDLQLLLSWWRMQKEEGK